jgi:hypothetical protein
LITFAVVVDVVVVVSLSSFPKTQWRTNSRRPGRSSTISASSSFTIVVIDFFVAQVEMQELEIERKEGERMAVTRGYEKGEGTPLGKAMCPPPPQPSTQKPQRVLKKKEKKTQTPKKRKGPLAVHKKPKWLRPDGMLGMKLPVNEAARQNQR